MKHALGAVCALLAMLVTGCSPSPATPLPPERATAPPFLSPAATISAVPGPTPTPGFARSVSQAPAANGFTAETHRVTGWLVSNAQTKRFDGATLTGQSTDSPQVVVPFTVLKPYLAANGIADRLARGEP